MKLHYRMLGEGPAVLILHGLFGMNDNWQSFGRHLSEKGYRVLLADLRNHGHSPHAAEHSYPRMAEDVAQLLDEAAIDQPVVIGHSMGGKVVLQCLSDFPGLLKKGVVIDIAPWEYPVHHREILDALLAVDLQRLASRKEADEQLAKHIREMTIRQFLLKNLYHKDQTQYDWRFNLQTLNREIENVGVATWPPLPVNTPLLFVRGEKSPYIDPDRLHEILYWYPEAELITIPGAGHWVHADQPQRLLEEILHWL